MLEEGSGESISISPSSPLSVEDSPDKAPDEIMHEVMCKMTVCVCTLVRLKKEA